EEEEIADLGESQGGDSSQQSALTPVGKLLTVRSYNFEALQQTLKQVWSPSRGVSRWVRVLPDISKPLRRSRTIRKKQGTICIVHYKYERLPMFCFLCGTLGHTDKDSSGVEEDKGDMEKRWGLWLRASPHKGRLRMKEEVSKLVACRKALSFVPKPETHACTDKGRGTISMEKRGVDTRNLVVGGGIKLEGRANDLTSTFSISKEYNDHVSAIRTMTPEAPMLKEGESGGSSGDNGDDDILPTPGFEVGSGGRVRKGGSCCRGRWKKLARRTGSKGKGILPVLGDKRLREDDMEIEEVGSGKRGLFETSVVAEAAVGEGQPRLDQ
ncbi:SLAIN motif-containing protein 2, partial [Bienertia sinuspersici]